MAKNIFTIVLKKTFSRQFFISITTRQLIILMKHLRYNEYLREIKLVNSNITNDSMHVDMIPAGVPRVDTHNILFNKTFFSKIYIKIFIPSINFGRG